MLILIRLFVALIKIAERSSFQFCCSINIAYPDSLKHLKGSILISGEATTCEHASLMLMLEFS